MSHFIYLLWPREFATHNEATYKIGKTTRDPHKRLAEYVKGNEIILVVNVDNCHTMESSLIKIFDELFVKRTKIGNEYYSGDVARMRHEIFTAVMRCDVVKQCLKQKKIIKNNIDIVEEKCLAEKQSTPILLKQLIPLTNCDDKSDDASNDESVEFHKLHNCEKTYDNEHVNMYVDNSNTIIDNRVNITNVTSDKKTIKTFCKHIYDSRPKWYIPDSIVDIKLIENAYREYFCDNKSTPSSISRLLKGKIFHENNRVKGVTMKKLVSFAILKRNF